VNAGSKGCRQTSFSCSIRIPSKGADIDRLTTKNKEICPFCHEMAIYAPDDYTFMDMDAIHTVRELLARHAPCQIDPILKEYSIENLIILLIA